MQNVALHFRFELLDGFRCPLVDFILDMTSKEKNRVGSDRGSLPATLWAFRWQLGGCQPALEQDLEFGQPIAGRVVVSRWLSTLTFSILLIG